MSVERQLDPRARRTRRLIQQAFKALLNEKPFNAITVQDITERAEINRATFYDHFPDKYALMEDFCHELFRDVLERHHLDTSTYDEENLRLLLVSTCKFLAQFHVGCALTNNGLLSKFELQITEQLNEVIRTWLMAQSSDDSASERRTHELRATVTSWAIYGAALHWEQHHRQLSLDDHVQQVMPLIFGCLNLPLQPQRIDAAR